MIIIAKFFSIAFYANDKIELINNEIKTNIYKNRFCFYIQ